MRTQLALVFMGVLSAAGAWAQSNCQSVNYVLLGNATLGTRTDFGYEGGVTRVLLQTPAECPWQITNVPSWITILSATSGINTTIVVIGVETNTATTARAGMVTIGPRNFGPINQAAAPAGCTFTLQSPTANIPADGTAGGNRLNSTTSTCKWVSFSNRNWLQLFPIAGTGTTDFTYTVFPNFSTGQRTGVASIGGQDFSVLQSATTGSYNERLVRLLYFNFLGRLPAPQEIAFHVQNLNNGMLPVDLALNFMGTEEFNIVGRFIAGLYVGILVRDAEFSGWLFQRNAVSTGAAPLGSLVANFLNSAEYAGKFGNPANDQFVRLLYQNILGRTASNAEVQGQVNALNGGLTRPQLTANFLNSAEFRNSRGPRLTAFIVFATLLSRDPSPLELPDRMQRIQNSSDPGATVRAIVQEIINSLEFTEGLA